MGFRFVWPLMVVLLIASLYCCGDVSTPKLAAKNAVASFHEGYNTRNYSGIYRQAHQDFKSSGNLHNFKLLMQSVYSNLGSVKSTINQNCKVNKRRDSYLVVPQQKTEFKKGVGFETFRYLIKDKKAILAGYKINSRRL